jgi:hypothetical protein
MADEAWGGIGREEYLRRIRVTAHRMTDDELATAFADAGTAWSEARQAVEQAELEYHTLWLQRDIRRKRAKADG